MKVDYYYIYSTECVNKHKDENCDKLKQLGKCDIFFGKLFCKKTCGKCDSGSYIIISL